MKTLVEKLISKDFDEIISSSLSLDLLKVYSIMYLGGSQPKSCTSSQRMYYEQLKKDGIMKAEKDYKKTCKVNWSGNRYISKQARHFNDQYLTDEEAIKLLKLGHLNENDFVTLPEDYVKEKQEELEVIAEIEAENKTPKKPKTKKIN